jgi:pimeloyl-ACP methyl ester carboxylesterase
VKPEPLLLYVPGLRAKPPPRTYARELFRCLVEGVRRIDPQVAAEIHEHEPCFDIAGWTYDFYGEHRDIELDLPGIERVLREKEASPRDVAEAVSLKRRFVRWLYRLADHLPFLIPQVADERLELHLEDLRRYVRNEFDGAEAIRRLVKLPLRAAEKSRRPVLLIGHSMGSVIAWDTLWQMSRESGDELCIDLFMTMGSPLGQRYIQRRLKGAGEAGERRYPANIRRWVNIAAVGELTAIDMRLRNDFGEMMRLGLVESIEDFTVFNPYRTNGELNVHSEYGYLVNEVTATLVRDWWRDL